MLMVVVAFLAIAMAGFAATARDRNRPDFMAAIYCVGSAFMAAAWFSQGTGRAVAWAWGYSLASLAVFFAGQLWYGLVFTPLPPDGNALRLMAWYYWPPIVAGLAGGLGGFLARRRHDRLHPDPAPSPAA